MIKIVSTIVIMFLIIVPFLSTPLGEELYSEYQETTLHRKIYCQYVDWFGVEGFEHVKYAFKCKIPDMME